MKLTPMSTKLSYELEAELRVPPPRRVRFNADVWSGFGCLTVILIAITALIGGFALHDLGELYSLRARGATDLALITGKRTEHGKSDSYYVTYSLQKARISINDEEQIP